MTVLRQADWIDPSDLTKGLAEVLDLLITVAMIANERGCCAVCGAQQPQDVRWPAFAFELESKTDDSSFEIDYRTCPTCEPRMNAMLEHYGLPRESAH